MSRRQRRKSGASSKSRRRKGSKKNQPKKGLWWKVLAGLSVVLIVASVIGYFKAKAYLHSEEFRELVSKEVSGPIGTEGSFGEFKWDGLSGATTGFEGEGVGAIKSVDVKDISFDVDLSYIKRDVFKIKKVEIEEVNATIDLNSPFMSFQVKKTERGFWVSLLPEEVELYDAEVRALNATIMTSGSDYSVKGVGATIERDKKGKGFDVKARGGKFKLPLSVVESAYLKEANLKVRGEELYLNNSEFSVHGSGKLELNGFVDLAKVSRNRYELQGKLSELRCKDVFPPDWQKNLMGEVVTTFSVAPHHDNLPLIKGHLEIKQGTLKTLPVLDKIAYYLADPKYRTIAFEKFECDFEKYEEKVILRNVVLSSKDLLKIEGDITFEGNKIEGLFNVGLPPEKLSKIPGAETLVFQPGKERMSWTKVRIWGTVDDIEEDLTDRLIAAAGQRIIDEALSIGGDVIKPERVKQAADIAGEGLKMLKGEKSLLEGINGILGGGQKKPEEKEKAEEEDTENGEPERKEEKGILPIPLPIDPRKIPDIIPF